MNRPGVLFAKALGLMFLIQIVAYLICHDVMIGGLLSQIAVVAMIGRTARRERAFGVLGIKLPTITLLIGATTLGLGLWQLDTLLHTLIPFYPASGDLPAVYLGWNPVLTFISIAIGAPLAEEMLMRGLLLPALLRRVRPSYAVVIQAVLFGALHVYPLQILATSIIGVVLGLLAVRTRSIIPGIIVHALNNAIVFLTVISANVDTSTTPWLVGPAVAIAIGTLIIVRTTRPA